MCPALTLFVSRDAFAVGTNMEEALLKVNSRLQQVTKYPENADQPVISTSNSPPSHGSC